MRISDWSSDVCSSDLSLARARFSLLARHRVGRLIVLEFFGEIGVVVLDLQIGVVGRDRFGIAARAAERDHRLAKGVAFGSAVRSEEHTSELQSLMRISYAVFCLNKKNHHQHMQN